MPPAIAFLIILSIPLWGYSFLINPKLNPRLISWVLTLMFLSAIYFYVKTTPLVLMLLYITSTFLILKIVVAYNHLANDNQLKFSQWLIFSYGWFGMNPRPFLAFPAETLPDFGTYIIKGFTRIVFGFVIINMATFIFEYIVNPGFDFILHVCYLVGLSLILHFGILNISTGILRWLGINVTSLFKEPIRSKSLTEFWSKRWNLAFVELTTIAVLRPVKSTYGPKIAFWASFIFSGLLHEMAISLPVESGFGKPFLYFIIQAVLILTVDRYLIMRQSSIVVRSFMILCCLFLPIFLLFHKDFITQVVIPLAEYLSFSN